MTDISRWSPRLLYTSHNIVSSRSFSCLVSTIPLPLCRCRSHLPLRRSVGSNPILPFCRRRASNQRCGLFIPCIRKDVSSISVLTCNGNSIATERKNGIGTTATEWWKAASNQASHSPLSCRPTSNETNYEVTKLLTRIASVTVMGGCRK